MDISALIASVERLAEGQPPCHKRWTGREYDLLVDAGAFEGQRLELIERELFEKPPKSPAYACALTRTHYALLAAFPSDRFTVMNQCPMRLGAHSRPEPALAVLEGPLEIHRSHPTTALVAVEVGDVTLDYERRNKLPLYARHALPEVWILNLRERCLEVYRAPTGGDADPRYGDTRVLRPGESVAPLAMPDAPIAVADLLP